MVAPSAHEAVKLELSTNNLNFRCDYNFRPVSTDVFIKNNTADRYLLKINCTSKTLFRVQQSGYLVEPWATQSITLWYGNADVVTEGHHSVFLPQKVDAKKVDKLWSKTTKADGKCSLPVHFNYS